MCKRPIFAAAVVLTMAIAVIYGIAPHMLKTDPGFSDRDRIVVTGQVYRIEEIHSETSSDTGQDSSAGLDSDASFIPDAGQASAASQDSGWVRVYLRQVQCAVEGELLHSVGGSLLLLIPADIYVCIGSADEGSVRTETDGEESSGTGFSGMELQPGNRIRAVCRYREFRHARNYGNFEEEEYYASLGIFLKAEAENVIITSSWTDPIGRFLNTFRNQMVDSIYQAVEDPETAGILAAICTGDRSGLTDETRLLYRKSGIIHILAVSGLHISLIGMKVFRLLRKRLRFSMAAVLAVILMLGFCVMSSASASAVRATIMFLVQIAGIGLGKKYDILCAVSLAAILMLAGNPLFVINSAFQLSFAAVLAVGLVYPRLSAFFLLPEPGGYQMKTKASLPSKKLFDLSTYKTRFLSSLLMSLSVTVTTLPLIAASYYEIPVYTVLLNLAVIPLMSAVLGAGLASSLLGMISLLIGRFFCAAGVYAIRLIQWACRITEQIPLHTIVTGCPEPWRMLLYYVLLAAVLLMLHLFGNTVFIRLTGYANDSCSIYKHNSINKHSGIWGNKSRLIRGTILFVSVLFLVSVLSLGKNPVMLRMTFLDVGQGDGILLENPSGTVYLFDGGSSSVQELVRYRLADAVKYYGISHIDSVIISHPDTDHISGVEEMLANEKYNLTIGQILIPDLSGNEHYERLCALAGSSGAEVIALHEGMTITDGDLVMRCLHPAAGYTAEDANSYSAVIDIRYGEFSALMTGDIGEEVEELLLSSGQNQTSRYSSGQLSSEEVRIKQTSHDQLAIGQLSESHVPSGGYDLLKVAHHGSRYSSSAEFLERISPRIAVISAGVNNIYGHPHAETLERFADTGAIVYVTSQCGEIIVEASPDGHMKIRTKL